MHDDSYKYELNEYLFIYDSIVEATRAVRRVRVLDRMTLGGKAMYVVVPTKVTNPEPINVWEEDLDFAPHAYHLTPFDRALWLKNTKGRARLAEFDHSKYCKPRNMIVNGKRRPTLLHRVPWYNTDDEASPRGASGCAQRKKNKKNNRKQKGE